MLHREIYLASSESNSTSLAWSGIVEPKSNAPDLNFPGAERSGIWPNFYIPNPSIPTSSIHSSNIFSTTPYPQQPQGEQAYMCMYIFGTCKVHAHVTTCSTGEFSTACTCGNKPEWLHASNDAHLPVKNPGIIALYCQEYYIYMYTCIYYTTALTAFKNLHDSALELAE